MEKVYLSDNEKSVLHFLQKNGDILKMPDLSKSAISVAVKKLEEKEFVKGHREEGGTVIVAVLLHDGSWYLEQNPNLENPLDENELRITNLKLQNEELKYQETIRSLKEKNIELQNKELEYKDRIKHIKITATIIGIIGAIVSWIFGYFQILTDILRVLR